METQYEENIFSVYGDTVVIKGLIILYIYLMVTRWVLFQ